MNDHPRLPPGHPKPHQLHQVLPVSVLPPPLFPAPRPPGIPLPPERGGAPVGAPRPRHHRRRRLRPPRLLTDSAFWTGVLTALGVAGLLMVIVSME